MSGTASEAGFSLLEVLVVLAIVATIAVMLTATLAVPNRSTSWATDLSRFLKDARATALRSGTPVAVVLDSQQARAGDKTLSWQPPVATYLTDGTVLPSSVLVLDASGSAIVGPTTIVRDGQNWVLDDLLVAGRR